MGENSMEVYYIIRHMLKNNIFKKEKE